MKIFFGWAGPPDDILRRRLEPKGLETSLRLYFSRRSAISSAQAVIEVADVDSHL